jgi:hypothetical protein
VARLVIVAVVAVEAVWENVVYVDPALLLYCME